MASREFETTEFGGKTVVSLRHYGPYEEVNETWADLTIFAFEKGLSGSDTQAIGIVYDEPTKEPARSIRYDAALAIDPKRASDLELDEAAVRRPGSDAEVRSIRVHELEALPATRTVHRGPYKEIREAYTDAITSRLGSGGRPSPPYFEVYLTNPRLTPPEDLVTEIYFPEGDASDAGSAYSA